MKPLVCRLYDSHTRHHVWAVVALWGVTYHETWREALDEGLASWQFMGSLTEPTA